MSQAKLKLYTFPLSGNAHRADLFLSLLGLDYERIEVDLAGGEQRSEAFLAINPRGKVPVLVDGDDVITESNAILIYLATKYDDGGWLPRDAFGAAQVQQWLSVAAYDVATGPAAARLVNLFGAQLDLAGAQESSTAFLAYLEVELADRAFLAADRATLADVAVYSYVAHAPEGGVSLEPYQNLRNWIARVEALDGFRGMPQSAVGLAA